MLYANTNTALGTAGVNLQGIQHLHEWQISKKWPIYWQPSSSTYQVIPPIEVTHAFFSKTLHETYPLLKRETVLSNATPYSSVSTISNKISNTLATDTVENTESRVISEYNEDLKAYLTYVRKGCNLYDGVDNIEENVVVAVAPSRKNGLPWFGRVLEILRSTKEVKVRWMDRLESKTLYFYLTDNNNNVHFDTIICNGVEFEPVLEKQLMWKLVTPLSFIQSLNADQPAELTQQNAKIPLRVKPIKYDLSQMVFANAQEFKNFVKTM